jgi:hypothetical protein
MHANTEKSFLTRLQQYPALCERLESLLNIVENATGDHTKADAAEQAVLDEVRRLGHSALQSWADQAVQRATATVRQQQPSLHGNGEKKSGGTRCSGS